MAPPRFATEGNSQVVCSILDTIANKQNTYREPIKRNHALTKGAAQRLRWMEDNMQFFESVMDQDKLQTFMDATKQSILQLATANVERERNVTNFVTAIQKTQVDVSRQQVPDNDYQGTIDTYMKQAQNKNTDTPVQQEKYYRDISEMLGVFDDNNDEEIAVMAPSGGASSSSLTCPITGTLMQDPVKNIKCGHVYSRAGIQSHLSIARGCPIAGCQNHNMTMQMMEKDVETEMAVKREIRRRDREKQMQASQASDLVDSDED